MVTKKGEKELAVTPESRQSFPEAPGQWVGSQDVMQQQMFREKPKGEKDAIGVRFAIKWRKSLA